jgi:hypothetical protein
MWRPEEHPWQYDVLDRLPPGIDETLIDAALKLTPSERLDQLQALMDFVAGIRKVDDEVR